MRFYKRMEPTTVVPRMIPSEKLDGLVQPLDRSGSRSHPWLPCMMSSSARDVQGDIRPGRVLCEAFVDAFAGLRCRLAMKLWWP